ncbi:hypothetical protein N1851_030921 [Merluccius polli]|uniref:Uncharacterized protein n=1 Tax=Merluccius polli TaxID=89951 RepID=A0AA47M4V6_MERPO|nr:hypothetical protein N1851_030921 [Merluccius polli]
MSEAEANARADDGDDAGGAGPPRATARPVFMPETFTGIGREWSDWSEQFDLAADGILDEILGTVVFQGPQIKPEGLGDILLGFDFLSKYGVVVDFGEKECRIMGKQFPLIVPADMDKPQTVIVLEDTVIPPRSEAIIAGTVDNSFRPSYEGRQPQLAIRQWQGSGSKVQPFLKTHAEDDKGGPRYGPGTMI